MFQANICTRFHGTFVGSPVALFAEGVPTLEPRRPAYLTATWARSLRCAGAFLARHHAGVISTPVKGTLARRGPQDSANAEWLRASEKQAAETIMVTDLVRNDLGRVSESGAVGMRDLPTARSARGVWHLESTVEGQLAPGGTDADLRALELIAELEVAPRGVYCGATGLASPSAGGGTHRVALGVGGGSPRPCLHTAARGGRRGLVDRPGVPWSAGECADLDQVVGLDALSGTSPGSLGAADARRSHP